MKFYSNWLNRLFTDKQQNFLNFKFLKSIFPLNFKNYLNALPHKALLVPLTIKSILKNVRFGVRFSLTIKIIARRVHLELQDIFNASWKVFFVANEICRGIKFFIRIGAGSCWNEPCENSGFFTEGVDHQCTDLCVIFLALKNEILDLLHAGSCQNSPRDITDTMSPIW